MAALAGDAVAAYLAKHRVEELVNDAVNEAVLANSTDPIAHIARALACAAGIELGGAAAPSCATGEDRMTALADVAEGTASPVKLRAARRSSPDELRLVDELTFDEARMAEILLTAGQQHVFADWNVDIEDAAQKRAFFESALALDHSYPGGLRAYLASGKQLLAASRLGQNPLDGWAPSPPDEGVLLQPGTLEFDELELLGVAELHAVGFVIPAGGMGERLGYSGVKFGLPAEMSTGACVLEVYAQYILAFERRASGNGKGAVAIPLALMVSHDTRAGIETLLRENEYFGLKPEQVTLLLQEKVACFADADGRLAMRDRYTLVTKPHGHGDVHFLLHQSGLAQRWLSAGLKYICFFQDTNTLYLATFLATLGASEKHALDMNSVCVPRKAKEAIGALAKLTHTDGRTLLASVEYNQLEPLLRASGKGGDVNDAVTGYSPFPGNINKLLFKLPTYVAALDYSKGELPEFVNPKYQSGSEGEPLSALKSPARLECMMQDFAYPLQTRVKGSKVGYTQVPQELGYFPIKNDVTTAAELSARGIPAMSASTAEAAIYHAYGSMLRVLGCKVEQSVERMYSGVRVEDGPHVVLTPSFCSSMSELRTKMKTPADVQISQRSTLIVDGANVTFSSLNLDGALVIKVAPIRIPHSILQVHACDPFRWAPFGEVGLAPQAL